MLAATVLLSSLAMPVWPQGILEEIVVTARRRAENIQDAPVAISAYSARMIEEAGINRMEDFIQLTPNVSLATSQGIGTSFLTIRGLTQVRNGESPAATIIDGVLQFNSRQFRQELFDVESIQVAKGPQGAIYGRNAAGGAVIITTKTPSNEKDGYIRGGFGEGDEYSVEASLSGPIMEDQLYGRISAKYIDRDGYLDNISRNTEDDPFEDLTIRGRLIWEATDDLTADLRVNVSRHDGRGVGFQFQGVDIGPDGITATGFGTDTGPVDADNVVTIRSNNLDVGDRDSEDIALKLDWETELGAITSTTAYNRLEEFIQADQFPYTNARNLCTNLGLDFTCDGGQTQYVDVEGWSQEFRLTSSADQRFRWNVGAYYLTWDRFISSTTSTDTGAGIIRVERTPATGPANPTNSFFADDNDNTAWAIFGQMNYDLTEQLELSFALRFDEEEREQNVSPLQFGGGVPGAVNKETFDAWQPKATVRYTPMDNVALYATWGVGFRSGQFNQNGVGAVAAGEGILGVNDVAEQEDSESFEFGLKSDWLDNRLRVNASIFSTDVEGQHYFVFIGGVGAQVLVNIDEVSLLGAEIDAIFRVTNGLDIYAAYGITSSEIDAYALNPAAVGNWAPYVPQSTFNIGGQYVFPLPFADTSFLARIDLERRGKQFWDPENSTSRSALELLNVRLGIQDNNDRWSVTASIENATDEIYNSEWVLGGFAAVAPGRVWGVDFRYNFF